MVIGSQKKKKKKKKKENALGQRCTRKGYF